MRQGCRQCGHRRDARRQLPSWFISYAPATSPRYVAAVAVTQPGLGSEAAVPISRVIHDELRCLP